MPTQNKATMKELNILALITLLKRYTNGTNAFDEYLGQLDKELQELWRFITVLKKKRYTDSEKDRVEAYMYVHGEEHDYQAHKIRELLRKLKLLLNDFLLLREVKTTPRGQRLEAEYYRKHGRIKEMRALNQEVLAKAKKEPISLRSLLQWEVYDDEHNHRLVEKTKASLHKSDANLNTFFLVNKLRNLIDELTLCRGKREKIPLKLKHEIKHILALAKHEEAPLIHIQMLVVKYFLKPNFKDYQILKDTYLKHALELDSDREFLLVALVNALIVNPNKNDGSRYEYLKLYRFGIENRIFEEKPYITRAQFYNIIFVAQSFGDYKLLEEAIKSLGNLILDKRERKLSLLLANAYLLFGKKEYLEAQALLKQLETAQNLLPVYRRRKFSLDIKCTYEQYPKNDAVVFLKRKEASLRNMLNRQIANGKIDEEAKQYYLNFISLVNRLAKHHKADSTKEKALTKLASFNGKIVELKWIKEKIAELKG